MEDLPYPTYNEMVKKLDDRIDLYAEYGKMQHIWCKTIYENPMNKDLIVELGKKIYRLGGMQALVSINAILKYFSPESSDPDKYGHLELYIENITE
jgi:hypothetical protein